MSKKKNEKESVQEILSDLIGLSDADSVCEELDEIFTSFLQVSECHNETKSGTFLTIKLLKKAVKAAEAEYKL